ncbi:MAG: hypothetical protein KGK00_02215 [Paracoccaceae bacterium]|nr:hypothetical protein [Paracoccaceae bacterium]
MMTLEGTPARTARRQPHATAATPQTKARYIQTVVAALRLMGANSTHIDVYRTITEPTDHRDWESEDPCPINYRLQVDLAKQHHMTERHWRRIERQLAKWGVIERATADNGYRGRHRVGERDIRLGISLKPSIDNMPYFEGLLAQDRFHEDERRAAMWTARATRKRVLSKIAELEPDVAASFQRRMDEIDTICPPGSKRQASIDVLTAFRLALCSLEEAVDSALERSVVTDAVFYEMSAAPDSNVRSYIQPTTPRKPVDCNAQGSFERTPGKPGEAGITASPPKGDDDCLENKHGGAGGERKSDLPQHLTLDRLKSTASEDFAMYLDAYPHPEDATAAYLREIGINVRAWEDAVEQMGWADAFISLVVIDRNRFHPTSPVISPGGTLRRFTELHRKGRLSLVRSLIGIWERDRMGTQPRTAGLKPN